jgi:hypothetical protein
MPAEAHREPLNRFYLTTVLVLMLVVPGACTIVESLRSDGQLLSAAVAGKWFVFWAIGVRLCSAGIRQATKPAFTARTIFHMEGDDAFVVIRELGFANICLGSIALGSLFAAAWRVPAAVAGGLFFGIAAAQHVIKRPAGVNELVALVSDSFITVVVAAYLALART